MRRKMAITAATAMLALSVLPAALAPVSPGPLATARAAVTKSLAAGEGGAGNVSGAGSRFGDLLSGWGAPVLVAFAGCLLVGALASRNIGTSVGIVLITLIGLIFLLSPQSIESLAKNVANVVF